MKYIMTKNNIVAAIAAIIIVLGLWVGLDAFFGLVGGLYNFLDEYIWAFFAGIIAFFAALFLVGLMFQITVLVIYLILWIIASTAVLILELKNR